MGNGIPLAELGTTTKKCEVTQISRFVFKIVLTQGLNRQIRRMCDYLGYNVITFKTSSNYEYYIRKSSQWKMAQFRL